MPAACLTGSAGQHSQLGELLFVAIDLYQQGFLPLQCHASQVLPVGLQCLHCLLIERIDLLLDLALLHLKTLFVSHNLSDRAFEVL